VAYAPEETQSDLVSSQAPAMQGPHQRAAAAQSHGLFTQPAASQPEPEPAPVHRPSLFGKVTGGWRRSQASQPTPEVPDLRRRAEPRVGGEAPEPAADVRAAIAEPDPAGLDIPAFLRRQDVMGR
jgi:cell division protein FtsZ